MDKNVVNFSGEKLPLINFQYEKGFVFLGAKHFWSPSCDQSIQSSGAVDGLSCRL